MKMPFPINYPEMVVKKSGGLTASENKLAILGYHTFLSLWSYPNPYKMQSNGKELCDLLIVFDKHIIIFSDKDCAYGNSGDALVDWRRWYKKAIQKSAEQLIGAKNWISIGKFRRIVSPFAHTFVTYRYPSFSSTSAPFGISFS